MTPTLPSVPHTLPNTFRNSDEEDDDNQMQWFPFLAAFIAHGAGYRSLSMIVSCRRTS